MTIAPGDLVVVVRWPCCGAGLGQVRAARAIFSQPLLGGQCQVCGAEHLHCGPLAECSGPHIAPVAWLKRIDPLPESERVQQTEEIEA